MYIYLQGGYLSQNFGILGTELILLLIGILIALNLMFTFLIAWSFDRGRPLDFFFRGLIFPTATVVILSFAFPW